MSDFYCLPDAAPTRGPGHKRRLLGQKPPLKPRGVWAIRIRIQIERNRRDLALFDPAIDSKLRSCDLAALRVSHVAVAGEVRERAAIVQQKTGRPVQFELTEQTREVLHSWITQQSLDVGTSLFPSRVHGRPHLSTGQYARIVNQ
jgi:integrase